MNIPKSILALFILLLSSKAKGQVSGEGCNLGSVVYTQYLGMVAYYGNTNNMVRAYRSNGTTVPINTNNQNRYRCTEINNYPAGSYYDSSIPPYGANVTIPAANDFTFVGADNSCVTGPSLAAAANAPNGNGKYSTYTYQNPTYCGSVPLDDYLPLLIILVGMLGFYVVKNQANGMIGLQA